MQSDYATGRLFSAVYSIWCYWPYGPELTAVTSVELLSSTVVSFICMKPQCFADEEFVVSVLHDERTELNKTKSLARSALSFHSKQPYINK